MINFNNKRYQYASQRIQMININNKRYQYASSVVRTLVSI